MRRRQSTIKTKFVLDTLKMKFSREDEIRSDDRMTQRSRLRNASLKTRKSTSKTKFGPENEIGSQRRNSALKTAFNLEDDIRPRKRIATLKTKFGLEDEIRPFRLGADRIEQRFFSYE